jgi:hypothetical protein
MGVWSKGTMGAPLGNQNAAKAHKWAAAIERALIRKATGAPRPEDVSDFIRGLDLAADEFVIQLFEKKDLGYFKELGDRTDGKPSQAIDLGSDPDRPVVQKVIREIVRPPNPDG